MDTVGFESLGPLWHLDVNEATTHSGLQDLQTAAERDANLLRHK